MKQLLIFDFDGVLCDSLECVIDCTSRAGDILDVEARVTPEAIAGLDSVTFPEIGRIAGVPENLVDRFAKVIFSLLEQYAHTSPVFAGIPEALQALSEKYVLGVVTANHPDVVRTVLEKVDGLKNISEIYGGDMAGHKSEKINKMCREFAINKERTWMIGDSRSDIREGKKAGVKTAAVCWGWQTESSLVECNPDLVTKTVPQFLTQFLDTALPS